MHKFEAIENTADVLDSRDIETRIDYLEGLYDDAVEKAEEAHQAKLDDGALISDIGAFNALALESLEDFGMTDDERDEFKHLKAFRDELEGYCPDWKYGTTLIRESYFVEYVEELLKDCGELPRELPGYIVVDWAATARNVRVDYTESEFDGVTYLAR